MVNSHHTQENRERVIEREQTGKAEMSLPEQIAFYDEEIRKAKSWITYYANPKNPKNKNPKLAATYTALVAKLEMKREIALAKLYASQMPDIGGTVKLVTK
jgi:cation transport regulator ChaC